MLTTRRYALIRFGLVLLLLLAAGMACSLSRGGDGGEAESEPTLAASITPPVTRTAIPTFTPFPTSTPFSGYTGVATATRIALYPTTIPYYTPFPTWTPIQATAYPYVVRISYPSPGSQVAGYMTIVGSASHPRFLQYALEWGPDPNPSNLWYPLTLAQRQPVINGGLAAWNTTTVQDGRYQLRLHVWLNDGTETFDVVTGIQVSNRAPTAVPTLTPTPRPNQAPVIQPIASRVINVGDNAVVDVQVSDPDNDPVNLFAASSSPSVAGVQVSAARQVTVTGAAAGTTTVTVTAADNRGGVVSTAFLVTVQGRNQPPSISPILNQQLAVGDTLDVPISVSDPDNDTLTVTAASSAATIVTAATPNSNAVRLTGVGVGSANVTVTVDDKHGGVISTTFQVAVGAPNLPPSVQTIPLQTLRAGDVVNVNYVATDPDGDSLSADVASDTPAVVRAEIVAPGVIRLSAGSPGQATVTLSISDGENDAVLSTFPVTVVAGNAPPAIQPVSPQTMSAKEERDLPFVVIDPESDPITATAVSDNPSVVAASIAAPGVIRLDASSAGTATVTLSVDDGHNAAVSTTFTVSVAEANQPPAIESIFPQTLSAGDTLEVGYAAADPEGDPLDASAASEDPNIVTASVTAPGVITLNAVNPGTSTVDLTVNDGNNPPVVQPFTVTVAQNAPPVVQAIGPVALTVADVQQVSYAASDPEGDTLNAVATSDNEGVVVASIAAPGSITLNAVGQGTATVTLAVDDGANAPVTVAFTVTVALANQPPVIQPIQPVALGVNDTQEVAYSVSDPDGDTLVAVAASDNQSVATATVTAPGVIMVTGVGPGTATVTLSINDGVNPPAAMPFTVTVAQANQPPSLAPIDPVTLSAGQTLDVPYSATDPDGDSLAAVVNSDNPGIVAAAVNTPGVVTLSGVSAGTANVTLSVEDGINPPASVSFAVTVQAVNELPVIDPIGPQTVDVNAVVQVPVIAVDPDGGPIALTAGSDNPGVASAAPDNAGQIVVSGVTPGIATITVQATDDEGSSATVSFTVAVRGVNNPPLIQPIPDQNMMVGEEISVAVSASDPDGDPLVVSAVSQNMGVVTAEMPDQATIILRGVGEGMATVEVTADDAKNGMTAAAFVVNVSSAPSNGGGFDVMTYPVVPDVSGGMAQALNQLYNSGVANFGNQPGAFAKVGDGTMDVPYFMAPFATDTYNLGARTDLQATIDFFSTGTVRPNDPSVNSFSVDSVAAEQGNGIDNLPMPAPGGSPCSDVGASTVVGCEYQLARPSIALIGFSAENVTYMPAEQFRAELQNLVRDTMSTYGVIPVLATIPADPGHSAAELAPYNAAIVEVASQSLSTGIPLWNLARAMQERGVADPTSVAPEGAGVLTDSALIYGYNVRNLTGLEVLQAVRAGVGIG